mgnify:CR=1 FL=1
MFPAIGVAVVSTGAKRTTDAMLMAASKALAGCSPLVNQGCGGLLPPLQEIQAISKDIALAIANVVVQEGDVPGLSEAELRQRIEENFWTANYRPYLRKAF